jgi:hypothetical protein
MRTRAANSACLSFLMLGVGALALLPWAARAGGPMIVGGPSGLAGVPFTWDPSVPVPYRVDGGPLARKPDGTVVITNAVGVERVQAMFKAWEDVSTASITFSYAGAIEATGLFTDGDVDTVEEYNAVIAACNEGAQSPIFFDANGQVFLQLTGDTSIIGWAGPCMLDPATGRILAGMGMFNGMMRDGIDDPYGYPSNYELTAAKFDEAIAHELGHFIGLDHSQINPEVLTQPYNNCLVDDLAGLPLMFPYAVCQAKSAAGLAMLAPDDLAWVSKLYPEAANAPPTKVPYSTGYATIRGTILFSDGATHAQGLNVIARDTVQPRRIAVSVFSGYRFTEWPGQTVTGTNDYGSYFGSRDPLLVGAFDVPVPPGSYHVWVEGVSPLLEGTDVGLFYPPIPNPGRDEYWNQNESATDVVTDKTAITVTAAEDRGGINVILNGTPPRFDSFESAGLWLHDPPPALRREDDLLPHAVDA